MRGLRCFASILLLSAASAASAEDWWLIDGEPSSKAAVFADAASIETRPEGTRVVSKRVIRRVAGDSGARSRVAQCGSGTVDGAVVKAGSADAKLYRFACGTPASRDQSAMMLGSMPPEVAAEIVFSTPPLQSR